VDTLGVATDTTGDGVTDVDMGAGIVALSTCGATALSLRCSAPTLHTSPPSSARPNTPATPVRARCPLPPRPRLALRVDAPGPVSAWGAPSLVQPIPPPTYS
jgi:hypothetical protein